MHNRIIIVSILFVSLVFGQSAGETQPAGEQRCKRDYLQTPEPGTCLQPKVYRFLQALQRIEENPIDTKGGRTLLNFLEPRIKLQVDTTCTYDQITVPLRIYYRDKSAWKQPAPIVLYIHGGGFIAGNLDQYDLTVKKLTRVTRAIYVSVGYRLAPEYPFPAAVNDCYAAWQWVVKNVEDLAGNPDRMYIMGSSAGANLAAVVALKCRDEKAVMPHAQLLFYPPTTFREDSFPSRVYFTSDTEKSYLLTEEFIRKGKASYMGTYSNETDPYLSPLDARLDASLPPALIQTAQCDPLRDEGRMYAEKLRQAGVRATYREYEGMIHGFLSFWMFFREGRESMKEAKKFMDLHTNTTVKM
jgi:acetyl esterase